MDSSQSSSSPYLSPQNELKDSEPCLICGAPTLERHFQVISCNACAAFFRRSVKIRSSYKCQRNQGNCNINIRKKGRPICRYCRLKKCYDVGMKNDESAKIKSSSKFIRETKLNNHPKPSDENALKSATINVERVYHEVQKILEQEPEPCTSLDNLNLTKKFAEELSKKLVKPKQLLHLNNSEKRNNRGHYYETFLIDVAQLLLNVEYYSFLPFSQKFALYKRFWQMFQLILNSYRAFVYYGNDLTDMRYPIDNDHFIDIENTITEDHNEATLFLLPVLVKSKMLLLHIKKISPTIFEFAYICQLTLWSCAEIEELSRETCQLAEEMLQKSSDELHDYYVNDMHMNNYAARQAELIKIVRLADFVFRDKKQLMAANQVFNFIEHNLRLTVLT